MKKKLNLLKYRFMSSHFDTSKTFKHCTDLWVALQGHNMFSLSAQGEVYLQ